MRTRNKRGFNLIEVATVLGVVGLVVGAIWVGAAALRENMAVKSIKEGIFTIANNAQNLISINQAANIGQISLDSMLIAAGAVPKDWIKTSSQIKSPQGYTFTVANKTPPERMDMILWGIPESLCIKLIVSISTAGAQAGGDMGGNPYLRTGLAYLGSSNSWYTTTFPVDIATAGTACSAATYIVFTFGYTRVN